MMQSFISFALLGLTVAAPALRSGDFNAIDQPVVTKRDGDCSVQPTGSGPVPTPDTPEAFLTYAPLVGNSTSASTPSGYNEVFINVQGSVSDSGYLTYKTLTAYNVTLCKQFCDATAGCVSMNIYYERDPSLDAGSACPNPASTTNIKCSLYSTYLTGAADNTGQYRDEFQVVITGSNGYSKQVYDTINYGAFTNTATYSVANQLGIFDQFNLSVNFLQVPNSTYAFQSILGGQYDILTASIDNAVNFKFNSNQPVTVVGQLDQGPDLIIASVPGVTSISQLKGKPIMVDSPVSGYAYLLRKALASNGLQLNTDYYFMTVGGTNLRYADLVAGQLANGSVAYASINTYPFTALGESLTTPLNTLARISDYVEPISSSALTIAQSSLSDPGKAAIIKKFVAAMYYANVYLNDPANKACVVKAIADQLQITTEVATLEYTAAVDPVSGEISDGGNFTVNTQGLENIINVRSEFGGFSGVATGFNFTQAIVPGTGKLIDYSLRDAALSSYSSPVFPVSCC